MADNITLNTGTGGATLAADDVASVWYQRVKLTDGTADSTTPINSGGGVEANALRVTIASDSTGLVSVDDNGASLTIDNAALSVTGSGLEATALRVTLATDSTGVLSIDDNGSSLTVDGTVAATQSGTWNVGTVSTITNVVSVDDNAGSLTVDNSTLSVVGGGVEATALRVTLASDSTGVISVDDNGTTLSIDDGAGSITVDNATLSVVGGGVEASALRVTLANDSTGVLSVDDNGGSLTVDGSVSLAAAIPAGTNTIGNVGLVPQTSGGLTISRVISAATTNATSVKGSAGQVFGWFASNINAAARYLKLYNKATAPTVGTDTPVMTILIPGNTAGAGTNIEFTNGIAFGTGIGLALTTGVADADTAAVAANEIVINLLYK